MATTRLSTGILPPSAGDVLLIEDDPQLRESALELLSLGGLLVAAVGDGAEALRFLEREAPCLIILDLRMPVLDGWEFLRRRATNARLAGIPVLIWSGEPAEPALQAITEGWIPKPSTEEELLDGVTQALRRISERTRAPTRRAQRGRW